MQDKRISRGVEGGNGCLAWLSRWAKESAWTPLFLKGAGYGAAAILLFAVGSGALAKMFSGEASAPPLIAAGSVMATGLPSSSASVSAGPADAGVPSGPADAGAVEAKPANAQNPAQTPAAGGVTADGKVVLNLATEEDLKRLPGVGPAKAKAILELRTKLGKFRKVEELLRVKGFGRRKLARIRPLLLLDPPPTAAP